MIQKLIRKDWHSEIRAALCLLPFFAIFLFLNRAAFSLGYLAEDYGWYHWTQGSLWKVLKPGPASYYRPLAANVPYYFSQQSPLGPLYWRAISFLLVFMTTGFVWKWTERKTGSRSSGFIFSLLWLFSPLNVFGVWYLNAFDYLLTPFFLLGFFVFFELEFFALSLFFLVGGLLSKELFYALPIAFLWPGPNPKKRILSFSLSSAAVIFLLLVHRGFSLEQGIIGGFPFVHSFFDWIKNLAALLAAIATGRGAAGWERLWFALLWLLLALQGVTLWKFQPKKILSSNYPLLSLLFVFVLSFLLGIQSEYVAYSLWIPLLGCLFSFVRPNPQAKRGVERGLLIFTAVSTVAFSSVANESRISLHWVGTTYADLESRSKLLLEACGKEQKFYVFGLEEVFPHTIDAEQAYWVFSVLRPGIHVHLVDEKNFFPQKTPKYWADSQEAENFPQIHFARTGWDQISANLINYKRCLR